MGVLSRKSIETFAEEAFGSAGPRLRRTLSTLQLVAFGVACTVGAGIFSLTGEVALPHRHQLDPDGRIEQRNQSRSFFSRSAF